MVGQVFGGWSEGVNSAALIDSRHSSLPGKKGTRSFVPPISITDGGMTADLLALDMYPDAIQPVG